MCEGVLYVGLDESFISRFNRNREDKGRESRRSHAVSVSSRMLEIATIGARYNMVIFDECGLLREAKENVLKVYEVLAHRNPSCIFVHLGSCAI